MKSVKEFAYAKINLHLDVLSRREDGFHSIETLMHSLTLRDEVTVTLTSQAHRAVRLIVSGNRRLPTDSKNIAYLAAMKYLDKIASDSEVTVKLNKSIPVAAGLAGGSSDAAAVLRAMNRLFNRALTDKMLLSLAGELGSDVAYCLIGGTALCRGRGEEITRLTDSLSLSCVVAIANEHVSTPLAYASLDRLYNNFDGSVPKPNKNRLISLLEDIKQGRITNEPLYNIFEDAVLPQCPGALYIKKRLVELGATHSLMSGSGPSVFGIFEDERSAMAARDALINEGLRAYYATSAR